MKSTWKLLKDSFRPCPHYCVFVVIANASIDSRRHYRFDAFLTVQIKTFENDRIARSDVSWTLCARKKHRRLRYFRSSFSFWCVFDHPPRICRRFCFDPLSRAFSSRCVFDENAQPICEDGRPKRIEMYEFSNEIALVWTGPKLAIFFSNWFRSLGNCLLSFHKLCIHVHVNRNTFERHSSLKEHHMALKPGFH